MLIKCVSVALVIVAVLFPIIMILDMKSHKEEICKENAPVIPLILIEAFTWFLATFGVSDGAVNVVAYRGLNVCDTKRLPGTMLVGAMTPVGLMSVGFLNTVSFDHKTLVVLMIVQSIGGFVGASLVKKMNMDILRIVIASCLLSAAIILSAKMFLFHISGGQLIGLSGGKLILAAVLLTLTEALTMMGFSNTTPNICILLALGMSPLSVYPIVMTANSVGCAVGCIRFIKDGNYIRKAALIEGLAGTIGVVLAIRLVTSMSSSVLQIIMIVLMLYSAVSMFREHFSIRSSRSAESSVPEMES